VPARALASNSRSRLSLAEPKICVRLTRAPWRGSATVRRGIFRHNLCATHPSPLCDHTHTHTSRSSARLEEDWLVRLAIPLISPRIAEF
jgi:hypothetical protein